jgi:hypothetical protein
MAELEFPQGVSTITPPPLLLSSEMYSPNCQLLLSSRKQSGIKIEKYYNKAVSYAGIASVIAVIQIFTLIHQMEFTPTPSVSIILSSLASALIDRLIITERFQCFILDNCYASSHGWIFMFTAFNNRCRY